MSSEYKTYFGPYVQVDVQFENKTMVKCSHELPANLPENVKYCPVCSCNLNQRTYTMLTQVVDDSCIDEKWKGGHFSDRLFYNIFRTSDVKLSRYVYMPNQQFEDQFIIDGGRGNGEVIQPIPENINKINRSFDSFKETYKDEIELLKKTYGEQNVLVTYGILCYYN